MQVYLEKAGFSSVSAFLTYFGCVSRLSISWLGYPISYLILACYFLLHALLRSQQSWLRLILSLHYISDPPGWIRYVAGIAGNNVNTGVREFLPACCPNV